MFSQHVVQGKQDFFHSDSSSDVFGWTGGTAATGASMLRQKADTSSSAENFLMHFIYSYHLLIIFFLIIISSMIILSVCIRIKIRSYPIISFHNCIRIVLTKRRCPKAAQRHISRTVFSIFQISVRGKLDISHHYHAYYKHDKVYGIRP